MIDIYRLFYLDLKTLVKVCVGAYIACIGGLAVWLMISVIKTFM